MRISPVVEGRRDPLRLARNKRSDQIPQPPSPSPTAPPLPAAADRRGIDKRRPVRMPGRWWQASGSGLSSAAADKIGPLNVASRLRKSAGRAACSELSRIDSNPCSSLEPDSLLRPTRPRCHPSSASSMRISALTTSLPTSFPASRRRCRSVSSKQALVEHWFCGRPCQESSVWAPCISTRLEAADGCVHGRRCLAIVKKA